MSIELKMPALSPTMEKGTLARWLVKEGDAVSPGDLIAEIETDKATMEYEATEEGIIASLVVPEGSADVAVGTVIARLAEKGEAVPVSAFAMAEAAPAVAEPAPAITIAASSAPAREQPLTDPVPAPPRRAVVDRDASVVNATPLARRIAAIKGLSLSNIAGTGPRGRIVKADLGIAPLAPAAAAATAISAPVHAPPAGVPVETIRLSGMRKAIARRLTEAKQTVPHFYLTARCNLDPLLKLRAELNAGLEPRGSKLSVNDMLIKAIALALVEVPEANVQFGGEELHRFGRVDVAMAVAIDGGLVTPVIKDVASLSLSAISQTSKSLAARARDGKLMPEEYQGGTVSISNLGMFGIDEMFPIINLPQALIVGIGAGVEQPWKVDGTIGLATIAAITASFDHRAIDGAIAAWFMASLRNHIEAPLLIVS